MAVGIIHRIGWIADSEILRIGLAICPVIGACNHGKVTHLVDNRASLRVCACHGRSPKSTAEVDIVRLIGIYIGIVFLLASTIEFHRSSVHRIADGAEMCSDCAVARSRKSSEPGCITQRGLRVYVRIQIAERIRRISTGFAAGCIQRGLLSYGAFIKGGTASHLCQRGYFAASR